MKKSQLTNLTLSIFILMAFVLAMSAMLFNGILDKVAKELQISISETGLLSSAYAYGAAIGVPILLILFRKMERTKALKIMLFTTIVATTWMILALISSSCFWPALWRGLRPIVMEFWPRLR